MKRFLYNMFVILTHISGILLLFFQLSNRTLQNAILWKPIWDFQVAICTVIVVSLHRVLLAFGQNYRHLAHYVSYFLLALEIFFFVPLVIIMVVLSFPLGAYESITRFFDFLYWFYVPLLVMIIMLYNRICLIKRVRCIK